MEELQETDVLWPETPPPPLWRDRSHHHYLPAPELHEATAVYFSGESFGSEPAASSSRSTSTLSALLSDPSSDGFLLSDPSTAAGRHDDDDVAEEFQEADVLWPDDVDATREREVDGGELWWLCYGFEDAGGRHAEPAAGGKREAWRPALVSSPIDIPTGVAAARFRRPTTAVPVHPR